ncbi:MAG TPA: hypothetical protein PKD64_05555 [Pirellulaceae bacterium]|nr:hypothetical protein [Pirellulaceae bacterium]HMO91644.1 hypothetical protein [Pirellulaceae bacterium]HMP68341.1 hypothetical protein [Pirellulaceae bacterium]
MKDSQTFHIISVGQCSADNANITRALSRFVDCRVEYVESFAELVHACRTCVPQLVLVNRILDSDGSNGIEIIDRMKSDQSLRTIPVMLVSNLVDAQDAAVNAGALRGFGKSELNQPVMETLVRAALGC